MNGPGHYKEAERLLDTTHPSAELLARAQVHATLAATAATIDATEFSHEPGDDDVVDLWQATLV